MGWSKADYECVCNYNVENPVFPTPNEGGTPIGYLYEFDCKALVVQGGNAPPGYMKIAFEHQVNMA